MERCGGFFLLTVIDLTFSLFIPFPPEGDWLLHRQVDTDVTSYKLRSLKVLFIYGSFPSFSKLLQMTFLFVSGLGHNKSNNKIIA
jgi:hypothetical protein